MWGIAVATDILAADIRSCAAGQNPAETFPTRPNKQEQPEQSEKEDRGDNNLQ
jgi:hypothetical protein